MTTLRIGLPHDFFGSVGRMDTDDQDALLDLAAEAIVAGAPDDLGQLGELLEAQT